MDWCPYSEEGCSYYGSEFEEHAEACPYGVIQRQETEIKQLKQVKTPLIFE
jgi:hypothetical protein